MSLLKVESRIQEIADFDSFTVFGDPGCDGLGADIMSTFAKALTTADSDFGIIIGDLVPVGTEEKYEKIKEFVDIVSERTFYPVFGNHDSDEYLNYFGLRNYALVSSSVLFLILDNSKKEFTSEALNFLREILGKIQRENIVLIFHVPPPNRISSNSMDVADWEKARAIYTPWKSHIRYILSGHVHTYFEDLVDGIPLVVSGGGGARLEYVSDKIDRSKAFHHILKFYFSTERELRFSHITLDGTHYEKELQNVRLESFLQEAFRKESRTYFKYALFAEDAGKKGLKGLEKLLRALSRSAYFEARNHFNQLNKINEISSNLDDCITEEIGCGIPLYEESLAFASKQGLGLARYTFYEATQAINEQRRLLIKAREDLQTKPDIYAHGYFVCSSCGYVIEEKVKPLFCPICGAPFDKIIETSGEFAPTLP